MDESITSEDNNDWSLQIDKSFTAEGITIVAVTAFNLLNRTFFNNELSTPAFVVGSYKRKGIDICGAYLRPGTHPTLRGHVIFVGTDGTLSLVEHDCWDTWQMAVVDTVLHEMVHYYNYINGVVDCDENGVHNEGFRDAAMTHGLDCRYREETGWAATGISVPGWLTIEEELTESEIDALNLREDM